MVRYMNSITHCFLVAFLMFFLTSCGTLLTKESENKHVVEKVDTSAIEPVKVDLAEEINKLDKRLTQRLDSLERLIKGSHKRAKKAAKPVAKKTTSRKTKALKPTQSTKIIIGEVEWVYLHTLNQSLKSRVDSGATTSSITASNIQPFERDGKNWVKFDVMHSATETKKTIEAPVVRTARIRQASLDNYERRFVVSLDISLGNSLKQKAEFSLADRREMTFPILLGREFLQDITLIDVGRKFLHPKYKPEAK